MKILGISNPSFTGVTVATRAICTDYFGIPHIQNIAHIKALVKTIQQVEPDLLVVGGWSQGYMELLADLQRVRNFPVIGIWHGTLFHGRVFNDEVYTLQLQQSHRRGEVDFLGFVQPQMAEYFQRVKKIDSLFVPHFFAMQPKIQKGIRFRVGIFGGTENIFKNAYGSLQVTKDFIERTPHCEVLAPPDNGIKHPAFLDIMKTCSVLVHLSYLECYSNIIQEAWARGIPVITSPACDGLTTKNPLMKYVDNTVIKALQLSSGTDAMELYDRLTSVQENWMDYSDGVHSMYKELSKLNEQYLNTLFRRIVRGFREKRYDLAFAKNLFTEEGIDWKLLA